MTHDMDGLTCWCKPTLRQFCPESGDVEESCPSDCWRCKGTGLVAPYDDEQPVLVMHKPDRDD